MWDSRSHILEKCTFLHGYLFKSRFFSLQKQHGFTRVHQVQRLYWHRIKNSTQRPRFIFWVLVCSSHSLSQTLELFTR